MLRSSSEFPYQNPDFRKVELYARAAALVLDTALYAEELSEAGRQALAATSGLQDVANRGNGWPLTDANDVQSAMRSRIQEVIQGRELPPDVNYWYGFDYWGSLKYYDYHDLAGIYDAASPRQPFVTDVQGWTNAMAKSGWPLLVQINAAPSECLVVEVFDDTPKIQKYFQELVEGSTQRVRYESEDPIINRLIDPRVLVFGDPAFIEECMK